MIVIVKKLFVIMKKKVAVSYESLVYYAKQIFLLEHEIRTKVTIC